MVESAGEPTTMARVETNGMVGFLRPPKLGLLFCCFVLYLTLCVSSPNFYFVEQVLKEFNFNVNRKI